MNHSCYGFILVPLLLEFAISRIRTNLHEAIGNQDSDHIRSYRRALISGIARVQKAANREADARGWDPVAVNGMLQEVEESTATLLPATEQVLQELEEEARTSWEERAVFHATQVTNLTGEAFETLCENRWSQRHHGVPGGAGLGDENLPKDLRRARLIEHAGQDAQ